MDFSRTFRGIERIKPQTFFRASISFHGGFVECVCVFFFNASWLLEAWRRERWRALGGRRSGGADTIIDPSQLDPRELWSLRVHLRGACMSECVCVHLQYACLSVCEYHEE